MACGVLEHQRNQEGEERRRGVHEAPFEESDDLVGLWAVWLLSHPPRRLPRFGDLLVRAEHRRGLVCVCAAWRAGNAATMLANIRSTRLARSSARSRRLVVFGLAVAFFEAFLELGF